jgi:hypothetical protein
VPATMENPSQYGSRLGRRCLLGHAGRRVHDALRYSNDCAVRRTGGVAIDCWKMRGPGGVRARAHMCDSAARTPAHT